MTPKITINDNCPISADRLLEIATRPDGDVEILHHGRNRIYKASTSIGDVSVKKFCNKASKKLLYSICKTKAQKSYEHALLLLERGINTPMPVGFIEWRNSAHLPLETCYICAYQNSLTLYEAILRHGRPCLAAFASFVAELHEKGIRHDDLNNSNVRVTVDHDGLFSFSLIDLNRMKIYPPGKAVPIDKCFDNICRFSTLDPDFIYFVMKYIECRNMSAESGTRAVKAKRNHDRKVDAKKWFKKLIKLQYI